MFFGPEICGPRCWGSSSFEGDDFLRKNVHPRHFCVPPPKCKVLATCLQTDKHCQMRPNVLLCRIHGWYKCCLLLFIVKVKLWITFNEPMIFTCFGYGFGLLAPGIRDPLDSMFTVAHNVIRAHARAWHTYDHDFRPTQSGFQCSVSKTNLYQSCGF